MRSILLVTSSPRGTLSVSTRVARKLVEKLHAALPGSVVVTRDLVENALPHIDPNFVTALATPTTGLPAEQKAALTLSDSVVEEVLTADTIVIGAGIINFSIPSTLKAWLDHLARSGRTFRYTENGSEGLIKNKKVYVIVASGGVYSGGPASALDHAVPYLMSMLKFLGMDDVEVIRIEGLAMGSEVQQEALTKAQKRVDEIAAAA